MLSDLKSFYSSLFHQHITCVHKSTTCYVVNVKSNIMLCFLVCSLLRGNYYLTHLLQDHPHTTATSTSRVRSIVRYSSTQALLLSPLCQGKSPASPPPSHSLYYTVACIHYMPLVSSVTAMLWYRWLSVLTGVTVTLPCS
jgi:hypothetical protein